MTPWQDGVVSDILQSVHSLDDHTMPTLSIIPERGFKVTWAFSRSLKDVWCVNCVNSIQFHEAKCQFTKHVSPTGWQQAPGAMGATWGNPSWMVYAGKPMNIALIKNYKIDDWGGTPKEETTICQPEGLTKRGRILRTTTGPMAHHRSSCRSEAELREASYDAWTQRVDHPASTINCP